MQATKGGFKVDQRRVFWYFTLPLAVMAVLLAMYFSGVRVLETIISAPYFESVGRSSRREFGLLENLQNLVLLAAIVAAGRAVLKHPNKLVKAFMAFVVLAVTVLFLEEIDYGLHFYEYVKGTPLDQLAQERNLHNVGRRTEMLKQASTVGLVVVFGLAPFLLMRVKQKWVRYFLPDPYMALLLMVAFAVRTAAHELEKRGFGYGLEGNVAEFRELVVYYLGLCYTLLLARRNPDASADIAQTES